MSAVFFDKSCPNISDFSSSEGIPRLLEVRPVFTPLSQIYGSAVFKLALHNTAFYSAQVIVAGSKNFEYQTFKFFFSLLGCREAF